MAITTAAITTAASTTLKQAISLLRSGMHIFVHGAAATPTPLLQALVDREDLRDIHLYHLHLEGDVPFLHPDQRGRFHSVSLFAGASARVAIAQQQADFIPVFLSDIPALFRDRVIPLDAAIIQLSPPDRHGVCSLGTSVDTARAAIECSPLVIAEINQQMPRTLGNTSLAFSQVSAAVLTDRPLPGHSESVLDEVEERIGENVARLIEDGSTLQMGIGAIPDAVLKRLTGKRDLGVHTEMFSDGLVDLIRSGAVNNRLKNVHPGRSVTSFVSGSRKVFEFVHDNPLVEFHPCDRTNDTALIRRNDRVVALNSALQVDLSGQICADSLGHKIYSGIGGQMDFIRGAALSKGGKPIIALPSTAAKGTVSRIVAELSSGSGVVTTRGHVHWVVTEYGARNLRGLNLRERAEALIALAHPKFREQLKAEFRTA